MSTGADVHRGADVDASTRTLRGAFQVFLHFPTPRLIALALAGSMVGRAMYATAGIYDLLVFLFFCVLWPLQEWYLHDKLLHFRPRKIMGVHVDPVFARRHRAHHEKPRLLHLIFLPVSVVVPAIPISVAILWFVVPSPELALTAMVSWFGWGLLYEWTHFLTHTQYRPRSGFYTVVQRNHMRHHFKHERYWFAFTWPYFDTWFGTDPDPKTIETSPTVRTLFAEYDEGE